MMYSMSVVWMCLAAMCITQGTETLADSCTDAHNTLRALHRHTPPLSYNSTLAASAQRWANHLTSVGHMVHSGWPKIGENLFEGEGTPVYTYKEAVDSWYDEINLYSYKSSAWSSTTGHFTQVVWASTTSVGCAKAVNAHGKIFIVAQYYPAGNFEHQFRANVRPLV